MTRFEAQQSRLVDPDGHHFVKGAARVEPKASDETMSLPDDIAEPISSAVDWLKDRPLLMSALLLAAGLGLGAWIGSRR